MNEELIELIRAGRRKSSKSAAWWCADRAAQLGRVKAFNESGSNFPDWDRLEADIEAATRDVVIVTRHEGLVEWLRSHGITGRVISHATADDIRGRDVVGALPYHLAALSNSVSVIDMPALREDQRGKDLTPVEMDAAGATMKKYRVIIAEE